MLLRQVATAGHVWEELARSGRLPGRTARALECRWTKLKRTHQLAAVAARVEEEVAVAPLAVSPYRWSAAGPAETPGLLGSARDAQASDAAWWSGMPDTNTSAMVFVEAADRATGSSRRRGHGRPWTQALQRSAQPRRNLTPNEERLSSTWGAQGSSGTVAVVSAQATQRLARGAEVAVQAEDVLPTIMGSRCRVPLVSGAAVEGQRLMLAAEAACLLNVSRKGPAWLAAERKMGEGRASWRPPVMSDMLLRNNKAQ